MTTEYSDRDIEIWPYTSWDDAIGNRKLKEYLKAMGRSILGPGKGRGINTMVLGSSRSGKTSSIEFFVRWIMCWNSDQEKLRPCGQCQPCLQRVGLHEWLDADQFLFGNDRHNICFLPIDGNRATQADIDANLFKVGQSFKYRWICYIDEIQGLVRRHLDHSLFKAVEQYKHITWIVSTATTKGLDPMFRNRFTDVITELPKIDEMAIFLARRCRLPGVNITWDDDTTLIRLAERSKQITGKALKCLAKAKMFGGHLTRELVEQYAFEQIEI